MLHRLRSTKFLRLLCFSTVTAPIFAQGLSFGVIGGMELNSDFHYRPDYTSYFVIDNVRSDVRTAFTRTRFVPKFGVKLEYEFTPRWAIEADILIHHARFSATSTFDPPYRQAPWIPSIARSESSYDKTIWEIPVLAKRSFFVGRRSLILEGGPSFRPFGGLDGPGRFGITGGVGTMWRTGRIRLQPSLRYTRWSDIRQTNDLLKHRRDEISLLLAVDTNGATLRGTSGRQPLSIGFIGGTTLTKAFPMKQGWEGLTSRLAGAALDYRFNNRWSAEADVIYHPLTLSEQARATVLTWEFPLMAKYRFGSRSSRPLLMAGPAFRSSGNRNSTNASTLGFTTGVGWEIAAGRLKFEPALRYVRWGNDPPTERSPASTRRDQVQTMLSIRYGGR